MDNILFSINAVAPVFLIVLSGYILKKKNFITDSFLNTSTRVVFTIALPLLIFKNISGTDFNEVFSPQMVAYAIICTLLTFSALCIISCLTVRDSSSRGAFIQGAFRSNYAIIGLPLIYNLFGDSGVARGALLLSFLMPLYNILSTYILTVTSPDSKALGFKHIIINVLKNPLIIATVCALPFAYFHISIPLFAATTIDYLSNLTMPLALFSIGGFFSFKSVRSNLCPALSASAIKVVISPIIFTIGAYFMGFRNEDLGVIFILFSAPTAVASYIMAKAMGSNSSLAANIILLTTLGSGFSIAIGVFILRSLGLI